MILEVESLPPGVHLAQIYSDYMQYLIKHARRRLIDTTGDDLWQEYGSTAKIIISHPNLWDEDQLRFLREAAVSAGIITQDRAKDKLHFVEEAEAASRYYVSKYSAVFGRLKVSGHSIIQWGAPILIGH